jgi:hypothetical protein
MHPPVVGLETREVPNTMEAWVQRIGTIDCGLETMRAAWPTLEHRFAVRREREEVDSQEAQGPGRIVYGHHRYPATLLTQ